MLGKKIWWPFLTEVEEVIINAKFQFMMVSRKMLLHVTKQIGTVALTDAALIPTKGHALLVATCRRELIEWVEDIRWGGGGGGG